VPQIVLSPEQSQIVAGAIEAVEVLDDRGELVGRFEPRQLAELIAESRRRLQSPGPRYTAEEVREHMRLLEEAWEREGGFDRARMLELLAQFRAAKRP
jgi:hypothetical protein